MNDFIFQDWISQIYLFINLFDSDWSYSNWSVLDYKIKNFVSFLHKNFVSVPLIVPITESADIGPSHVVDRSILNYFVYLFPDITDLLKKALHALQLTTL